MPRKYWGLESRAVNGPDPSWPSRPRRPATQREALRSWRCPLLSCTATTHRIGLEVCESSLDVELPLRLVSAQRRDEVARVRQVVPNVCRVPHHVGVVVLNDRMNADAPQTATGVVRVFPQDAPAILVNVESSTREGMLLTGLEYGVNDPHTVNLVAHQIRIRRACLGDGRVGNRLVQELVVVVGNDRFCLADQLEVEPVRGTIECVVLVDVAHALGVVGHRVVGKIRCATNTTL